MDEPKDQQGSRRWHEVEIPLRGCRLNLSEVAEAFGELQELCQREGERVLSGLRQPDQKSDADWQTEIERYRTSAFRLTCSVIGGTDNMTRYGETISIFQQRTLLPRPINTIFFTNENSFRRHASGDLPPNRFKIWLHFHRDTIFKSNFLLSDATLNLSQIIITADDITFLRATQNIIVSKLMSRRLWYRALHERYSYDVGLWTLAFPYSLFISTSIVGRLLGNVDGSNLFALALFVYICGVILLIYRLLFAYAKWALPVNVLDENEDSSSKHRALFGIIIVGLVTSLLYDILKKLGSF